MHLLFLVLVSLLMVIVSAVLSYVLSLVGVDVAATGNMLALQAVTQLLCFLLPVLLVVRRYYREEGLGFLRFDLSGDKWTLGLAGVVILLLLTPLIDWSGIWNNNWHWGGALAPVEEALRKMGGDSERLMEQFLTVDGVWGLVVNLIVIALIPAVCEELFFRAGIQNLLQRCFSRRNAAVGMHAAVWVTAAIFSLGHGEIFAFLPRFLLGALLGYLYIGGGSLLVNVTVHFFNNAIVVVVYWLMASGQTLLDPTAPLEVDWELTSFCFLAALALLYVSFGKGLKISR